MNIMYCGDEGVRDGMFLSVLSLCKNTNGYLNIFILTANVGARHAIGRDFADTLEKAISDSGSVGKVTLADLSDKFVSQLPSVNMKTRFTPLCMLRLFADEVDEIPDRILYLDCDVLCRSDFTEFYRTDFAGAEIIGVPDRYDKWFFGNIFKHDYLNSGVLLMNMKKIRQSGVFGRCRKRCRDVKMFMPDQTALNKETVRKKAENRYNEQGKIKSDTVFKHFTTYFEFFPYFRAVGIKPSDVKGMHEKLKIFEFDEIIDTYERKYKNE